MKQKEKSFASILLFKKISINSTYLSFCLKLRFSSIISKNLDNFLDFSGFSLNKDLLFFLSSFEYFNSLKIFVYCLSYTICW